MSQRGGVNFGTRFNADGNDDGVGDALLWVTAATELITIQIDDMHERDEVRVFYENIDVRRSRGQTDEYFMVHANAE